MCATPLDRVCEQGLRLLFVFAVKLICSVWLYCWGACYLLAYICISITLTNMLELFFFYILFMKFSCIYDLRLYFFGGILNDILYLYIYKEKLRFSSKHAHHIKVNTHSLKPIRRGGLFAASTVSSAQMRKKNHNLLLLQKAFFSKQTMFCAGKEKWVSSKMSLHYLYTT